MSDLRLHPVSWFDVNGSFVDIFKFEKEDKCNVKSTTEVCYINPEDDTRSLNHTTYHLQPNNSVKVLQENPHHIASGATISLFTLLTAVRFKGDYRAAESYVIYDLMKMDVPYVRIGTDYYKIIPNTNSWGGESIELKSWDKSTITEDHTKTIFKHIPKYDDFCIVPDNINYTPVHGTRYNLYAKFPHTPYDGHVTPAMIPTSMGVMKHIFQNESHDKLTEGFIYMKCLYEHPKQMLPIVVLLSEDQKTGKTTFLDWIYMIFGDNATVVNPESIASEFNASYAKKNVIMFEEAFFSKQEAAEKIKRLTTGKFIQLRDLYTSVSTIPLYCHLLMSSNKLYDFMRIESKETRYFPLQIHPVKGKVNTQIDKDLFREIPMFLKYLLQLPPIDFSKDRLVLTTEQTRTNLLASIKHESKTWMHKELEVHIEEFFNNNPKTDEFLAGAMDIKNEWFPRDNQVKAHYISKVLKQEIKILPEKNQRYYPFGATDLGKEKISTPFKFIRKTPSVE